MSDKKPSSRAPGARDGCGPADASASPPAWPPPPRLGLRPGAIKRYGPLLLIAGAMVLVFGMGWHGEVTLDNIVLLRSRFHHVLATHQALALATYCLAYICMTALSLPGGLVLTLAGGLLFGCWLGGRRPFSAPLPAPRSCSWSHAARSARPSPRARAPGFPSCARVFTPTP